MSNFNTGYRQRRILQLIESLIDDSISEADFTELVDALQSDPQALAAYVDYLNIHSALRQNYLSHSYFDENDLENDALAIQLRSEDLRRELPREDSSKSRAWSHYALATAATLLVACSLLLLRSSQPKANVELPLQDSVALSVDKKTEPVESVAVLTRLVDVVWEDEAEQARLDMPLPRQQLRIKSGLMQVEFYCGAAVIIEGPAAFELLAPDRGFAHHGKLRAHVPPRARGFTIATKSGNVVDLGTEFGLDISEAGLAELHVIDGEVDYHDLSNTKVAAQRLIGGQAIEVTSDGTPHKMMESDASRFVNHSELNARANRKEQGQFRRWQEYHTRLQSDPALVADYVFQDSEDWGRTLVNVAPSANEMSYGAIVGAGWRGGRWPQSKALRFRSPSDRVRIKLDGVFDSLTLSTWVNIKELKLGQAIALLHPEINHQRKNETGEIERFIHWTLNPTDNGGAVLHFAESNGTRKKDRNHYSSVAPGILNTDLDQWIHIAVVYDRDNLKVSHYKDGNLVGFKPIKTPRPLEIGVADLGNWPYKGWAAGTQYEFRNLNGLMDEFVALGRAMSPDEIREIFEIGRP